MSELNKKKSGILKFVIFYTVLIVIITAVLNFLYLKFNINLFDYISKSENNEYENYITSKDISEKIDYSSIERSNLIDKYYINNIEIEEKTKNYGDIIDYAYYEGEPRYKVEVHYNKISGLKNAKIQEKINKEIREKAESLVLDDEINNTDINSIVIRATLNDAGSSDLISVAIEKTIEYVLDNKYEYKYYPSLNYRLDTGEYLNFNDLFTKDANVRNILSDTIYKQFAFEYGLDSDTGSGDLDKVDYGKIENDVYNNVIKFFNQDDKVFWFSQNYITVVIDENSFTIKNSDYSDYININNIVKVSESLYEGGNKEKINYVFGTSYMGSLEYFGKVSNNSFLSVFNFCKIDGELVEYDSNAKEYTDNLVSNLEIIKDAIKNDNKKDKNKGYVYNISTYYEEYYDENQNNLGKAFTGEKVEIDLENFEENAEIVYALSSRGLSGGEFYLSLSNLLELKKYKIYNIEVTDKNNDGEFEVGQKLLDSDDWESYYEMEYEY